MIQIRQGEEIGEGKPICKLGSGLKMSLWKAEANEIHLHYSMALRPMGKDLEDSSGPIKCKRMQMSLILIPF